MTDIRQQWSPGRRRTHHRVELLLLAMALACSVGAFWRPSLASLGATMLAVAYLHVRNGIGFGAPFVDVTKLKIVSKNGATQLERKP